MLCVSQLATYTCNNAGGTTCSKVAVTVPVIVASGGCTGSQLVLITSGEYDALIASGTAATTASGTANANANTALAQIAQGLNLKVQPYAATADDYASISAIFAVALVAGSIIWGSKQILRMLRNPSEA